MRVFLDANVPFSIAHRRRAARRNFALKSRGFEARFAAALDAVETVGEAPAALVAWAAAEGLPSKDAPILAAAAHCRAELLVTGDARDFGALYGRVFRGVKVVTPAQALQAVLGS